MKQTAVEWLIEQLPLIQQEGLRDEIEQAKEMEKQQIIDAYGVGNNDGCSYMTDGKTEFKDAEQYYNETYNTKQK